MLAKTTIVGIGLCAALGLVVLTNVAAPAAEAYGTPEATNGQTNGGAPAPTCVVVVEHSYVEGPICSSHFSYVKKEGLEGDRCGCPPANGEGNGPAGSTTTVTKTYDNDVVDAKRLVTVGDVDAHDLVDVKGNDVDVLEDIVENSDVDVVEENVVVVGGLL